jgi:hypothetical protein
MGKEFDEIQLHQRIPFANFLFGNRMATGRDASSDARDMRLGRIALSTTSPELRHVSRGALIAVLASTWSRGAARCRAQQPRELGGDEAIAIAGFLFHPFAIEDRDYTAVVPNQAKVLQLPRGLCHCGAPDTQHESQETRASWENCLPLRDREFARAIVHTGLWLNGAYCKPSTALPV